MLLNVMEERFSEEQIKNIRKAITHLNRFQFFHNDSAANNAVRKALTNPMSRTFISEAFNLMGYRFIAQETLGYFGIVPTEEINDGRYLNDIETFVLLGLKLVYDKCFDRGDFDEKANVDTSINEFCDELSGFAKEAGWEVETVKIRNALTKLSGNQIVSIESKLNDDDDLQIKIRPFIRDVISIDALERIELFLIKKTGNETTETAEIVEADEASDETAETAED